MKLFMKRHTRKIIKIVTELDMKILSLFIILVTLTCKSPKGMMSDSIDKPQEGPELTLVLTDNYGGSEAQEIQVVRDRQQLVNFFAKINRTRKPGLPVPQVDFTSHLVIIYSSGQMQGLSGHPLVVSHQTQDTLLLRSVEPTGKNQAEGTAVIQPFSIYTVPLTDKKVLLADQK
jgi:hypothetical protein